jgi:hypothetical protein
LPRQQARNVAQPPLGNNTKRPTAVFIAQPSGTAFEPNALLPDTGSNTAIFNNTCWFGNTLSPTSATVTGLSGMAQPEACGTASISVIDDGGTSRALSFEAHLDRQSPVNLVGLPGLKAAGLTSAEWDASEDVFRWQFKTQDDGPGFTISTRPTSSSHGLHAFSIAEPRVDQSTDNVTPHVHLPMTPYRAPAAPTTGVHDFVFSHVAPRFPRSPPPTTAGVHAASPVVDGLDYSHDDDDDQATISLIAAKTPMTLREAHEALGHIDVHRLKAIAATVEGVVLARHTRQDLDSFRCIDCAAGKQPRAPRPPGPHDLVATKLGIHCTVDLIGPLPASRQQHKYLAVFVDAMGAIRTFPLRSTADSQHALAAWARV